MLCRKGSEFYLHIQVKESIPEPDDPTGVLGVDLGIKEIAVLSDGDAFGGASLNAYRLKRHRVRKSLQSNAHTGSRTTRKNAQRALKRLSGKERRYQKDVNHRISKHIVETAKANGQAIALEDLSGIRDRTNKHLRKSQRGLHNAWAFYQFREFVQYKAARKGGQVVSIDPGYTSQPCSSCHRIGERRGKTFSCSNCGSEMDADLNGALVIAAVGASVIMPENSTPFACTIAAEVG